MGIPPIRVRDKGFLKGLLAEPPIAITLESCSDPSAEEAAHADGSLRFAKRRASCGQSATQMPHP